MSIRFLVKNKLSMTSWCPLSYRLYVKLGTWYDCKIAFEEGQIWVRRKRPGYIELSFPKDSGKLRWMFAVISALRVAVTSVLLIIKVCSLICFSWKPNLHSYLTPLHRIAVIFETLLNWNCNLFSPSLLIALLHVSKKRNISIPRKFGFTFRAIFFAEVSSTKHRDFLTGWILLINSTT